ncbi:MAG: signal recognition particle protein [Chloroflexi bacterium]|nr:signal recognition particle protein [Chloroflexota bacterium]
MFENLTSRLNIVFTQLRRKGKLSEADVDIMMREVRLALLEADVNYGVVKDFTARIRERAVGAEVSKALNPAQQVIKIVHEELISTLGTSEKLNLSGIKPYVIMLVGLQGAGKTTAAAKIARRLRSDGERVLLVACDPYRPAAVKQLQILGEKIGVEVVADTGVKPPDLAARAFDKAKKGGYSVVILDTAGRSQLDQPLMDELNAITKKVKVTETLLVVDAMIGQEALHIAQGFRDAVSITGLFFTKMEGDARGGAAISVRSVTGVPIKFLGVGEGVDAIETYDPARLASRILGMGDMIGLIEKAEAAFDQKIEKDQANRMWKGKFTLEDFSTQLKQLRKMGPLSQVMEMLPGGLGQMVKNVSPEDTDRQFRRTEAIINSMTVKERQEPDILNASRRRRIASGAGSEVQEVNRLIKQFRDAQRLMKTLQKTNGKGFSRLFK